MSASAAPLAIMLAGPTASGKTGLALRLADTLPVGLISVDSVLVYRGLDIGSAKPDRETLARYPHALIDVCEPSEVYSAARFRDDVLMSMAAIRAEGKTPLLVGGTMLYFKALIDGLAPVPEVQPGIRAAIERDAAELGWPALHRELAAVDPVSAARIHPNHSQRLCRALEVYRSSGRPISDWQRQTQAQNQWKVLPLAIVPGDRAALHARIAQRLEQMFAAGFIDEVRGLYRRGDLNTELPAVRAVGYRQVWEWLAQGEGDEVVMRERALVATRQLAKRQLTWLRNWPQLLEISGELKPGAMLARALHLLEAQGVQLR